MRREKLLQMKPGDVIGFSGRHIASDAINILTFGIPRWSLSHVGIMGYDNEHDGALRLFEADGKVGVRSVGLSDTIQAYRGRIWLYDLSRPLFLHEITRLTNRLAELKHRPYDNKGAYRSGGRLWSWLQAAYRGEDLTSLFCSELDAEVLSYIGVFPTSNASRWNPNHLTRKLRRLGIVNPPRRLK